MPGDSRTCWSIAGGPLALIALGASIYATGLVLAAVTSLQWPFDPGSWEAAATRDDGISCSGLSAEPAKVTEDRASVDRSPELPPDLPAKLQAWWRERTKVRKEYAQSQRRRQALELALTDRTDPNFSEARIRLEEEDAWAARLAARQRTLSFDCFEPAPRVLVGFLNIAFSLTAMFLMRRWDRHARNSHAWCSSWRVYAAIALIGVGAVFLMMYLGGIASAQKMWVGVDNFWSASAAWSFSSLSLAGLALVVAAPLSRMWLLTRRALVPQDVDPSAPDGQCAVGEYVSFLHVWTIIGAWIVLVPTLALIWVMPTELARFLPAYLPVGTIAAITVVLVVRMVLNALVLRTRYRAALSKLGSTWAEVEEKGPAPDPTIVFIGEDWWKLPALLGGLAFSLWGAVEWSGAAEILRGLAP